MIANKNMVRLFTFSQFHNKRPPTGSTQIRVNNLIKYWDEADLYKYGENPDVLIFQKVYANQDYQFPKNFKGIKILDICDPDWFNGKVNVKETIDSMDAVTCPTETMQKFIMQLTDKPVKVIKDRFDLSVLPKPKEHVGDAKTVVWFGYRHNIETLKPAMNLIEEHSLKLICISDDDPLAYNFTKDSTASRKRYEYIKYNESTIYSDIQKADFAIFPKGTRPEDRFKSDNKTIRSNLAGLPVAFDIDTFNMLLLADNRRKWFNDNYDIIRSEYDVRKSVKEMKDLIDEIS